jgi:hypothetical protein
MSVKVRFSLSYLGDKLTGVFLLGGEKLVNLFANFAFGNLDIVLGLTVISHQGEETIVGNIELVFC